MNFTVGGSGPPGAATLVSPSGTINDTTPTYTWNAVSEASYYRLYVYKDGSGIVHDRWYASSSVTSGSTCSVTPSTALSTGDHIWWIKTWNSSGNGPWSSGMNFTVSSTGGGFNEQFNSGSAKNWDRDSGTWNVVYNQWYYTAGVAGKTSYTTYKDTYSNFDYQARLWRYNSDVRANRLFVRVSGKTLSTGWPSNCYAFQYMTNGQYSVWKSVGGTLTPLQSWTNTSAIHTGNAWNELRVYANGSNFRFFINGTQVWSGSDSSLSSGRVGLGMYKSSTSSSDGFYVDWATLEVVKSAPSGMDSNTTENIDPKQRVLNKEANQRMEGNQDFSQ
jgi:hypothetical protein